MQTNEYEKLLLKCQYINTVCDSLLKELDKQTLSKKMLRSKILEDQKNYDNQQLLKQKKKYEEDKQRRIQKEKVLEGDIRKATQNVYSLKKEISQLSVFKVYGNNLYQQTNKFIRQISDIQFQLTQKKKLLNCQLQNLSVIQENNIKMVQTLAKYQKRQSQIKSKINKIKQSEQQILELIDLEQKYQKLSLKKRFLAQQSNLQQQKYHSQVIGKISAIAQSDRNLQQMQKYQIDLKTKIKQQEFIIDQIQKREIQSAKKAKIQKDQFDDSGIFQDQVTLLRKTIANRNFKIKNHTERRFDAFNNNPTPKNVYNHVNTQQKPLSKKDNLNSNQKVNKMHQSEIFKIQYEPRTQKPQKNYIKQRQTQNVNNKQSPVSSVSKNSTISQQKESNHKNYRTHKQQNKKLIKILNDHKLKQVNLDTLDVQTLQNILSKKVEEVNDVLKSKKSKNQLNKLLEKGIQREKIITEYSPPQKDVRNKQSFEKYNKKILYTQPVAQNQQQSPNRNSKYFRQANSRFIDQIIENDDDTFNKLKNNVRIRTKRTQSEKYNSMVKLNQHIKKNMNTKRNSQLINPSQANKIFNLQQIQKQQNKSQQKLSLKSFSKSFDQSSQNANLPVNHVNYNNQKQKAASQSFEQAIYQNSNNIKPVTLKYKEKVSTRGNLNKNQKDVIKKIQKIQSNILLDLNSSIQKAEPDTKISIFKLPVTRKPGNSISKVRKGKFQAVQASQSQSISELSKIEQQDQSIRKTKESFPID